MGFLDCHVHISSNTPSFDTGIFALYLSGNWSGAPFSHLERLLKVSGTCLLSTTILLPIGSFAPQNIQVALIQGTHPARCVCCDSVLPWICGDESRGRETSNAFNAALQCEPKSLDMVCRDGLPGSLSCNANHVWGIAKECAENCLRSHALYFAHTICSAFYVCPCLLGIFQVMHQE